MSDIEILMLIIILILPYPVVAILAMYFDGVFTRLFIYHNARKILKSDIYLEFEINNKFKKMIRNNYD